MSNTVSIDGLFPKDFEDVVHDPYIEIGTAGRGYYANMTRDELDQARLSRMFLWISPLEKPDRVQVIDSADQSLEPLSS